MARMLKDLLNSTALHNATLFDDGDTAAFARGVHLDDIYGNNNPETINGTSGDDIIHAYGGNDTINIQQGGNDTVYADAGDDIINAGATMTVNDHIDGGSGYNVLNINGNYSQLTIHATTMTNIQKLTFGAGHNYQANFDDANIAAGGTLTIDAGALGSGNTTYLELSEETNGNIIFYGGAGNDKIYTGSHTNILHLEKGGTDFVQGDLTNKGGTYVFYMGGALDASDHLDPVFGTGTLFLNGDYTAAHSLFLNQSTFRDMTTVNFAAGHSYNLVLDYSNVFQYWQTVDASSLGAGNYVSYDASACYSALGFSFKGGAGNDTFKGAESGSYYYLQPGGNDSVVAGAGNDTIYMGASLNAGDVINGGAGKDVVDLNGNYSAQVVFNYNTMQGIETLVLEGTNNYNLKVYDDTVAAGQNLVVNGLTLGSGVLTFDGSGETNGSFTVYGGAASDKISTGNGIDTIDLEQGGNDIVHAGNGNDTIKLNTAFNALDQIDGGAGTADAIYLNGNYSGFGTIFMNASTLTNVEQIYMANGNSYGLVTDDATVAAGQSLYVDSSALTAAYSLNFSGGLETDGSFLFAAGAGSDFLTGGAKNDSFYLSKGGNDLVNGLGGDDSFTFTTAFTAADRVDGGAGNDTVSLNGDYIFANAVTFSATTMTNVETLSLATGHSYTLTMNDATLAAGQTMTVNAATLGVANQLNFDASAETNTDANYIVNAGASDDILKGGAGNDVFGLTVGGNDTVSGGGGADTFLFTATNLTNGDTVDGGTGASADQLTFTTAGTIAAGAFTNVSHIEQIVLANGTNSLTLSDALVTSADDAHILTVSGGTGNDTVNASAVTTATNRVVITAGAGNDTFTGGAGADVFNFALADLNSADTVNGGTGVALDRVSFTTAGTIASGVFANVSHVEQVFLANGTNNLTLSDAFVGLADDAHIMNISGGTGDDTVNASAVTTAANRVVIVSGAGNDTLTGGAGIDVFTGGAGADLLTGNGGGDRFVYTLATDSSSTSYDTLAGIDFSSDRIDTTHAVNAIDAALSTGTLNTASFDADLGTALTGHLNPFDAMLFTANAGTLSGQSFLVVDLNGTAGYQANADLVFHITGQTGVLATTDFI